MAFVLCVCELASNIKHLKVKQTFLVIVVIRKKLSALLFSAGMQSVNNLVQSKSCMCTAAL